MYLLAALLVFGLLMYGLYWLDERTNGEYNRKWLEERRRVQVRREFLDDVRQRVKEKA